MGTITDIATLLKQAYDSWNEWYDARTVSSQELYSKYVAPSYALMKDLHSNYLEIYLELEERIRQDDGVSLTTVQWFARARAKRQVDRSEMAVLRFPRLPDRLKGANDVSAATLQYLLAVHTYFRPLPIGERPSSDASIAGEGSTASRRTERYLRALEHWSVLTPLNQVAIAADDAVVSVAPPSEADWARDAALEAIITVVAGDVNESVERHAASLAHAADRDEESASRTPGSAQKYRLTWQHLVSDHILQQRYALESRMTRIQGTHIRLRVLIDRK